jgi:hypothetical protein
MAEGVLDFGRGGGSENVGNGHRYLGARLDGAIDDGVASATWRWIETGVPFSNFGDSIPSRTLCRWFGCGVGWGLRLS